jgi:hypothetical protein
VEIKSSEREPSIKALQRLRPDLQKTVSELEDQLEILEDDIAAYKVGRFDRPKLSEPRSALTAATFL